MAGPAPSRARNPTAPDRALRLVERRASGASVALVPVSACPNHNAVAQVLWHAAVLGPW